MVNGGLGPEPRWECNGQRAVVSRNMLFQRFVIPAPTSAVRLRLLRLEVDASQCFVTSFVATPPS